MLAPASSGVWSCSLARAWEGGCRTSNPGPLAVGGFVRRQEELGQGLSL